MEWVHTLQVTSYHDSPQQESANFSCKGPETYFRLCRTQGVCCKLNNSGTVTQKQPQTMCKLEWLCSNKTLLTETGSRLDFAHAPWHIKPCPTAYPVSTSVFPLSCSWEILLYQKVGERLCLRLASSRTFPSPLPTCQSLPNTWWWNIATNSTAGSMLSRPSQKPWLLSRTTPGVNTFPCIRKSGPGLPLYTSPGPSYLFPRLQ